MKTILKTTMVIAFIAFASTLFAAGNLKLNILPISAEKAVVTISSISDSKYTITITDEKDMIAYYNENSDGQGNYRKVFNFSDLEDGTYKITVATNDLTTERVFNKKFGTIKVSNEKTNQKPFFGFEDGILRCAFLNFNNDYVTLSFFENSTLLYTKTVGKNFNVVEAINLSKLEAGANYYAVLSAGDKEYYYDVNIK